MIVLVAFPKVNQVFWLPKRKRVEDYSFHHTKDGGGSANPQRKSRNGNRSETPTPALQSQRVAQILKDSFDRVYAAGVPAICFRLFDAAKFNTSATPGFFTGHATADQVLGKRFDVSVEFHVHLIFQTR